MEEIKEEKRRSFWGGLLAGVFISGTILTVVFAILFFKNESRFAEMIDGLTVSSSGNQLEETELITSEFVEKADTLYNSIAKEFYFEEDVDPEYMREEMYRAIIHSLGDPYAEYYSSDELVALYEESEGVYEGIGSYVMMDPETNYPVLSGVFKGSPAEEYGLRDGDIICEVDGVNYYGDTLTEWVARIKGPEGTTVDLTVIRGDETIFITATRARIETPTVEYEMFDGGIGYIHIREFDDVTVGQFMDAYASLEADGMNSLIIDLRSNGGGNLTTVLDITDYLVPDGIITYTLDKNGYREEYPGSDGHELAVPAVVLTNGYTASASELLTGALKAYDKAVSIGTNTFGKGIVQTIYPMADGSGVKFTTSRYYTPDDICIHGTGIEPDIELEFDGEAYYAEESFDNQLEYAKDYLLGKVK